MTYKRSHLSHTVPSHFLPQNSLISRYLADIAREQAPPLPPILPHTATPPTTSTFVANAPFALPTVLPAPQHPQHPPMSSASSSSTWWHTSTHTTNSRDTSLDLVAGQYPPPPAHQYWAPHTSLGGCQLNPFTAAQSTPKMSTPLGIHVLHSHNGTALPPPSMASTSLPNNTYTPACISYPPNLPALWMMDGVVTLQGGSHVGGDDPSLSMPSVQSLSLPADVQPSKQWLDTSSLLHALSECGPADGGWNNPGVMQPPRT